MPARTLPTFALPGSSTRSYVLTLAGLAGCYFITAKIGLAFAFVNPSATALWPPAGIALAALLVLGLDVWPAILIGAFFANLTTQGSLATSLCIGVGNTLEAVAGAGAIPVAAGAGAVQAAAGARAVQAAAGAAGRDGGGDRVDAP